MNGIEETINPQITPITGGGNSFFRMSRVSIMVALSEEDSRLSQLTMFLLLLLLLLPKREKRPKLQNKGLQPTKYKETNENAFCTISKLLLNNTSANINGITPELPKAQQTIVDLPSSDSLFIWNKGSRMYFDR